MDVNTGFFGSLEQENFMNAQAPAAKEEHASNWEEHIPHADATPPHVVKHLLNHIHSEDALKCFGGYLYRDIDPFNNPILCFAVQNMTQTEISQADEWYNRMGRLAHLGFLHRTTTPPMTAGGYTVFEFEINPFDRTLAERHADGKLYKVEAEHMMTQLVQLLSRYQQVSIQAFGQYKPLCSLSMATLILGDDGSLRLLPLLAHNKHYPIEIPNEVASSNGADERSDLYAAAYVAVEIYSANRSDGKLAEPNSPIIVDCLKAIQDWRPSLQEVMTRLNGSAESIVRPAPVKDSNGNRKTPAHGAEDIPGGVMNAVKEGWRGMAERFRPLEDPETSDQVAGTCQPYHAGHQQPDRKATENGTFNPRR